MEDMVARMTNLPGLGCSGRTITWAAPLSIELEWHQVTRHPGTKYGTDLTAASTQWQGFTLNLACHASESPYSYHCEEKNNSFSV